MVARVQKHMTFIGLSQTTKMKTSLVEAATLKSALSAEEVIDMHDDLSQEKQQQALRWYETPRVLADMTLPWKCSRNSDIQAIFLSSPS